MQLDYIKENPQVLISGLSFFVALLALLVSIVNNIKNSIRHRKSLDPLLSFYMYEKSNYIVLQVQNTGKSPALNISFDFKELQNNGNGKLSVSKIFDSGIELYPNETIEGAIAISGYSISDVIFPVLVLIVSYKKGNDKRKKKYTRKISFAESFAENDYNMNSIAKATNSMMYSANRIANYVEGKWLATFDEINAAPKSSLFQDMSNAFKDNNREVNATTERNECGSLIDNQE